MRRPQIWVTVQAGFMRDTFLPADLVRHLETLGDVRWNETGTSYSPEGFMAEAGDAEICVTCWDQPEFTPALLAHIPKLRLIAHLAGSVGSLVGPAVYERGIRVVSGNEAFAQSVAEGVIAYILAAQREIPAYMGEVRAGGWRQGVFQNRALLGKTIGLIGFGAVSRHLVPLLKAFRTRILAYDKYVPAEVLQDAGVEPADPDTIFSTTDIVSLHLPKTPETDGFVDARRLALMRPGTLLVNTARGSVIDEAALIRELERGRIRAALDVFVQEPLAPDHPLRRLPNVLVMPHMAGPTIDYRREATRLVLDDIERFLNGEPLQNEITLIHAARMTRH